MKFISWNVNGIRSVLKKGFSDFLKREVPDFLCLQETRAEPHQAGLDLPAYHAAWNVAKKNSGYAGTALFSKQKPLEVTFGMNMAKHDAEGRVINAEFEDFYLVNVYTPNSKRDLSRLGYRTEEWDADFLAHLKRLEKKKPVVFCGDLNVAHRGIDLTHPQANRRNHGFTDEERAGFERFVKNGFIDTFRVFHSEVGCYTWWSPWNRCRERNIGWRIDYFLISSSLRARLAEAFILPGVQGSDHCPVGIVLES